MQSQFNNSIIVSNSAIKQDNAPAVYGLLFYAFGKLLLANISVGHRLLLQ